MTPAKPPSSDTSKPTDSTTPSAAARDTLHESTPTSSSGGKSESVGEPQTPSGSGQHGGVFSRLRKKVVEAAWQGTESKVVNGLTV